VEALSAHKDIKIPKDLRITSFDPMGQCETLSGKLEVIHDDPKIFDNKSFSRYEAFQELILPTYVSEDLIVYDTTNVLVSYNRVRISGIIIRLVNIQWLMVYMLAKHFIYKGQDDDISAEHLLRYKTLLFFISLLDSGLDLDILKPSTNTYGKNNISMSTLININRVNNKLYSEPVYVIPQNYYSAKSKGVYPEFNPADSPFFREDGNLIKD
jgi:hypothetical protein